MEYEKFKENLCEGIKNFYGDEVEIVFEQVLKNNGQYYDGIRIAYKDSGKIVPVIYIDEIYDKFLNGELSMKKCVLKVCKLREDSECTEELLAFAEQLVQWDAIKDKVYPVLISLEQNRELLQSLVYTQMLDLAVTYVVRVKLPDIGLGTVKICKTLLKEYGIDEGQLHETAMHNLKKDAYEFRSMNSIMEKLHCIKGQKNDEIWDEIEKRGIYVLSNRDAVYGAAGILNKELIKEFAEGRNFYVIPSSLHETIFMRTDSWIDYKEVDKMIAEINELVLDKQDVLADHCYYYDGKADEIRMCA